MSGELPEGWRWAKLGEVCNIIIGRTPRRAEPAYWGGTHPWATISDITASGGIVLGTKECLSDAGAALCNGRLLTAGTLMFSFKLSIGAMAFAGRDLFTNEAIAGLVLRYPTEANIQYLRHALDIADYDALTGHAVKGRTLNRKTLDQVPIPLPPLDEQRRIASTMELAHRARAAATEQLAAINTLSDAMLRELFPRSPVARLPRGWRWVKLGDVCTMGSGGTPLRGNAAYFGGSIPWAIIGDLNDSVVATTTHSISKLGLTESSAKIVPEGALLVAMYGSIGKLGITGVPMASNQAIAHIIPDPQVDSHWLFGRLRADRRALADAGSGVTQSNISQTVLKGWDILLPPLDEQRRIADTMRLVQRMRESAALQIALVNDLSQSLLHQLFHIPEKAGVARS